MKKKIVLVDDSKSIHALFKKVLESNFEFHSAFSCDEAEQFISQLKPDLIFLDVMMPEKSGLEYCSELKNRKETQNIPVVIVSARAGTSSRTLAYQVGAINYLEKPFETTELLAMAQSILKFKETNSESTQKIGDVLFLWTKNDALYNERTLNLTSLEFKLLAKLARNQGRVFSRQELLDELYSLDEDKNDRVIDTHIGRIRKKIKPTSFHIETEYKNGYRLVLKSTP